MILKAVVISDEEIRKHYLGSRLTAVKDALVAQADADQLLINQAYEKLQNLIEFINQNRICDGHISIRGKIWQAKLKELETDD